MTDVLLILSTSRCFTIMNQHRVNIGNMSSCLHRSHCQHHTLVQYRISCRTVALWFLF
jgi:hypothetical protein